MLVEMLSQFGDAVLYFQQFLPFSRELLNRDIRDLSMILEAVEQGRAKDAGDLARKHVASFALLMEKSG